MLYLLTKSLHILVVIAWLSGMVALAIGMLKPHNANLEFLYRWDRRVTNPALGLVWALGLLLAYWGGWFGSTWLWIKLAAVFVLSGLHGSMSGQTRRALKNDSVDQLPGFAKPAMSLMVVFVALAIFMVETKFY